jgi:phenol hydroxylase P0 protein
MGPRYQPGSAKSKFDPSLRFVRLRHVRTDGFVEFEFAIGEPELFVELVLPVAAFHEFCRANHVIQITPLEGATPAGEAPPDSGSGA